MPINGRARVGSELMDADRVEDIKVVDDRDDDKLLFLDPKHKDSALSSLNTLRRNRDFCDVILQVDHADLHVHRAVLASQSRFFYELFSESQESDQKSLPFFYKMDEQFDLAAFEALLNYAYTSRLEVDAEKVKAVYKTALVLKMKTPVSICGQYLIARLSVENCLGIRRFANSHYDESLSSRADSFIRDSLIRVIEESHEFRSMPKVKVEIVSTNERDSRSFNEDRVSALVLDWLKKSIRGNRDRLEEAVENDVNLLYLHSDNTLHDCLECNDDDDSAALNNSEIIRDYKRTTNKRTMVRNEHSANRLGVGGNGSRSESDESLHSGTDSSYKSVDFPLDTSPKNGHGGVGDSDSDVPYRTNGKSGNGFSSSSDLNPNVPFKQKTHGNRKHLKKSKYSATQEQEWKVIALTKPSETSILGIFILGQCDLAGVSIKMRHAPQNEAFGQGSASSLFFPGDGGPAAAGNGDAAPGTGPTTPVGSGSPLATSLQDGLNFQGIALPEMEFARCGMGAGSVDNKLIVCGGYGRGECLDSVEQFDPRTFAWNRLPDMLTPRGRFDSIVLDGKVYVVGGSDGSSELHSVEVYDPELKKWERVGDLPQPRSNAGVCALLGLLVVVGGSSDAVTSSKHCVAFDPKSGNWHQMASMNHNRNQAGVCSHNGSIYVVGGSDSWNCLNSFEVYDAKSDRWGFLPSMNTARRGCDVSMFDDRFFVVGGSDGTRSVGSTEIFDLATNQWTIGPQLNVPRANLRIVKLEIELDSLPIPDDAEAGPKEVRGAEGGPKGACGAEGGPKEACGAEGGTKEVCGAEAGAKEACGAEANSSPVPLTKPPPGFSGSFLFALGGFDGKNFLKSVEVLSGSGSGSAGAGQGEWQNYINVTKSFQR